MENHFWIPSFITFAMLLESICAPWDILGALGMHFSALRTDSGAKGLPIGATHPSGLGPIWTLMGPPGQVLEDYVNFPQDFWNNFARFGSKNGILTKWHNDSASFLLEKLKNHIILTKNPNI